LLEAPNERELEKYMMTDETGQTFYIYCKVFYEEITEEFLLNNYCIKKTSSRKNSRGSVLQSILLPVGKVGNRVERFLSRQNSSLISSVKKSKRKKSWYEKCDIKVNHYLVSDTKSNLPLNKQESKPLRSRKGSITLSFDELDIRGSQQSKLNMKARELSNTQEEYKYADKQIKHKKYYVPLAICIKTKHSSHTSAEQLLLALVQLLYTEPNLYNNDLHNLIYSYSEFLSHITMLTHIISPPPLTQYKITIGTTDVMYAEGTLTELPSENDISVAQLFSLLRPDCIITMWITLLLDNRVVLYISDINDYFFIIKGLNQLMFPFKWHFSKGILPDVSLLFQPVPYIYGIMDTLYPNKEDIMDCLYEEEVPFVLLDVKNSEIAPSAPHLINTFPEEFILEDEINKILVNYEMEKGLSEQKQAELSKELRQLFLKYLLPYIKDADKIFKKVKTENFFAFSKAYITHFSTLNPNEAQSQFIDKLANAQCFAALFDDMLLQSQSEYLRLKNMNNKVLVKDYVVVDISSPRPVVMSRIMRFANAAQKATDTTKDLLQTVKIDWINEIFKMQEIMNKELKKSTAGLKKRSDAIYSISSDTSSGNMCKNEGKIVFELTMIEENTKCLPDKGLSLATSVPPLISKYEERLKKVMRKSKVRKGILFYGPKGILSFCQRLFCFSNKKKDVLSLFDDIKLILDKYRNTQIKVKANSVNEPVSQKFILKSKDDSDIVDNEPPKINLSSPTLNALIDLRSLERLNLGNKYDEPSLHFSHRNSCQFFLFCALYYSKYQEHPYEIVKVKFMVSI